jgi:hypothetical protein
VGICRMFRFRLFFGGKILTASRVRSQRRWSHYTQAPSLFWINLAGSQAVHPVSGRELSSLRSTTTFGALGSYLTLPIYVCAVTNNVPFYRVYLIGMSRSKLHLFLYYVLEPTTDTLLDFLIFLTCPSITTNTDSRKP